MSDIYYDGGYKQRQQSVGQLTQDIHLPIMCSHAVATASPLEPTSSCL